MGIGLTPSIGGLSIGPLRRGSLEDFTLSPIVEGVSRIQGATLREEHALRARGDAIVEQAVRIQSRLGNKPPKHATSP